jgi:hypothetical protein
MGKVFSLDLESVIMEGFTPPEEKENSLREPDHPLPIKLMNLPKNLMVEEGGETYPY